MILLFISHIIKKMIETNLAQTVNAMNDSGSLIAMLEVLVSRKDASEKKRILADEYGMTMTAELERRIQIMCNWSESIRERERKDAKIVARIEALERMIRVNITKEQILSMRYTEAEYKKAESALYANV